MLGKGLESLIPKKDDSGDKQTPEDFNARISAGLSGSFSLTPPTNDPHKVEPIIEQTMPPLVEAVAPPVAVPPPPEPVIAPEIKLDPIPEIVAVPEPVQPMAVTPEVAPSQPPRLIEEKRYEKLLPTDAIFQIEVERITSNPHQPRREFNEEALKELASSIREFGVLQPLVVSKIERETENGTSVEYELIAGERRLMASKLAGLRTVPAIVRSTSSDKEKLELAIIENIQRADLNPIETARAFAKLQDEFKLTQREIAARLGKSREAVANSVRLLNLPSEIQESISRGLVSESQARLLLSIDDISSQRKLFEEILKSNLSVREVKSRIQEMNSPGSPVPKFASVNPETDYLKERLEDFLGTKIDLSRAGDGGKITISFYSEEELKAITEKLLKQNDTQSL